MKIPEWVVGTAFMIVIAGGTGALGFIYGVDAGEDFGARRACASVDMVSATIDGERKCAVKEDSK